MLFKSFIFISDTLKKKYLRAIFMHIKKCVLDKVVLFHNYKFRNNISPQLPHLDLFIINVRFGITRLCRNTLLRRHL